MKAINMRKCFYVSVIIGFFLFIVACDTSDNTSPNLDGDTEANENADVDLFQTDGDSAEIDIIVEKEQEAEVEEALEAEVEQESTEADETEKVVQYIPDGYRINDMKFEAPLLVFSFGGTSYDGNEQLNNQMAKSIADRSLNMLLIPDTSNFLAFPYDIEMTLGERIGSSFKKDPDNSYKLPVSNLDDKEPRRFSTKEEDEINIEIPIGDGNNLKLRNSVIRGTYSDDFTKIDSGFLSGALHQDDANAFVLVNYGTITITLAQALTWGGAVPTYKFEDGTKGYSMIFSYKAEEVNIRD